MACLHTTEHRHYRTVRLSNAAQNPVTQMHGIFACRVGLAKELSLGSRGRGVLVTFAAARGGRADSPCARAAGRTAELWPPGSPRSRRARPVRLFWPGSPGLIVGLAPFLVPRLAPLLLGTETSAGICTRRLRAALGTACCRNCAEYSRWKPLATFGSISGPGFVSAGLALSDAGSLAQTALSFAQLTPREQAYIAPGCDIVGAGQHRGEVAFLLHDRGHPQRV